MAHSLFVRTDASDAAIVVRDLLKPHCYRPARVGEVAVITLHIEMFDGGFCITGQQVPRTLWTTLADGLADIAVEYVLTEAEVVAGLRGDEVLAGQVLWRNGASQEVDLSLDAREVVDQWMQEGPIYAEDEASLDLLNVFTPAFVVGSVADLTFVRTLSGRVAPLVSALNRGAEWSWTEISGNRAFKVNDGSDTTIAVLSDAEVAELEPYLE